MDDTVRMQVLECVDYLHGIAFHLQLVQPLAPLQQLVHALVLAQLQKDIHILAVFEEVQELGDISMLH